MSILSIVGDERGEMRPGIEARLEKYPLPTVYDVCASPCAHCSQLEVERVLLLHFRFQSVKEPSVKCVV